MRENIKEIVEDFLNYHRVDKGHSQETIKAYKKDLNFIFFILENDVLEKGEYEIKDVGVRHIRKVLQILKDGKKIKNIVIVPNEIITIRRKISSLKSLYKFLVKYDYLDVNIMDKIEFPKLPEKMFNIPDLEMMNKIFEYLEKRTYKNDLDKRNFKLGVCLHFSAMARTNEIVNIKVGDIDFKNERIVLKGKGNKERPAYIDQKTLGLIRDYIETEKLEPKDFLIRNRFKQKISKRGLQLRLKAIRDELKLPKWVTPHKLRGSSASLGRLAGLQLEELQDNMGHSDPKTTRIYARIFEEDQKRAFKQHHPMDFVRENNNNNKI